MKNHETIKVKKHFADHNGIHPPKKQGDVGYDLVCSEDFTLPVRGAVGTFILPAGVSIKSPKGFFCQIVGRSSAAKRGISVQTATIDEGYTGPMFACCFNLTDTPIEVKKGEKLAQLVFHKAYVFPLEEVDELPQTERGETGFGSTGN